MHSWNKYILAALIFLTAASASLLAQNDRRSRRQRLRDNARPAIEDVRLSMNDTLTVAQKDSLAAVKDSTMMADSLFRADSLALLDKSTLNSPAFTSAGDSIVEVFTDGKRLIYYYGGVTVEYENMKLTADYMEYDMSTGIVFAKGTLDTLTGEWKGQPVMEQGKDTYEMEEVHYNFNTKKANIHNMTTQESEGILHGQNIKMMPDRSINISKGQYTVCDADEPHYYLHMTSAKVMTNPTQRTVFGPTMPVVEGVHLPLVVPFGFIPKKPERATGMLMPTFGEETARGFYVRDAGMYFVFGDYLDLSLTGDYYTLGSWAVDLNSRYKVNYKFNGSVGLTYSFDQTGEKGSPDFFQSTNFGVKWSHSQDSKAHPGTSFTASVNFSSPSNNKYNSRSVTEALQNQASSSISYSHNWNGKFNLSINALHSQNSRDSSYSFTLPNVTFSMSTIYPFKQKNRVGKEKIYEKFSIGYNTSLQNRIGFKASEFGQEGFLDKFQNGMTHNFSLGLPNFTLAKYIQVNPGVQYGMNWFFRKNEYEYNPETDRVEVQQGKAFSTLGITQTYSGSVSMSTRLYGMFDFGKYHKIQAIRHVVSPSISLSVHPELGTAANGWRTLTYTDTQGVQKTYDYNVFSGQMYSAPSKGRAASMGFQIGNNLEMKVRDFADTTGKGSKKVKLIDQLTFSGSYNFLADSLKLSNIGMTMSTSAGKLSFSGNLNFDPYAVNEKGMKINRLNILDDPRHPLRLTNASVSASMSFSGKGEIKGYDGNSGGGANYQRIYYHPVTGEYIPGGWLYYTNIDVPWSLNFSYSFNYAKSYAYLNNKLETKNNFTQAISVSGTLKLTPKMNINATSGFDVMAMKITTTQISAQYDLHCFNIAVSWIPMGTWQSYSFRIAANASALADILKFKKTTSFWDRQ